MDAGILSKEAGGAASGGSAVMVVPPVEGLTLDAAAGERGAASRWGGREEGETCQGSVAGRSGRPGGCDVPSR